MEHDGLPSVQELIVSHIRAMVLHGLQLPQVFFQMLVMALQEIQM